MGALEGYLEGRGLWCTVEALEGGSGVWGALEGSGAFGRQGAVV